MKTFGIVSVGLVLALMGCGKKNVVLNAEENKVTKSGVISVWGTELKIKSKKFDVLLHITNESKGSIIIHHSSMLCARGAKNGILKHSFFGAGEKTIDFATGQSKKFRMTCDIDDKSTGDFTITIPKVYENPTGDGRTSGKVIGSDIIWTVKDTH